MSDHQASEPEMQRAHERRTRVMEREAIEPLPPPAITGPAWLARLDLPFVLMLALIAWSFGGYINTNWVIQAQGDRVNSQSARITELHNQVNQHTTWMRQIQEDQKKQNEETTKLLASINLQLSEIKGAAAATQKLGSKK